MMLAAFVPVFAACGSGGGAGSSASTTSTTASTVASTTTVAVASTTVIAATTSDAPTTTEEPLPVPLAAPVDENVEEPYVDLGRIQIPAIGVDKQMLEGVSLTTLDVAPGHWPGTAMPGQLGNVVVAGHRVSHDHPFRNLDKLVAGDQVIFTTTAGTFTYLVDSIEIVKPDAVWIVDQSRAHTATLFACHPPHSTKERIVVHLTEAP
jgi:sortase A